MIDRPLAARLAAIARGHVAREYPHKLDQVLNGDGDLLPPRVLHPAFFGSFDWHSCVHGWWLLLTLRRLYPDLLEAAAITALADTTLTPANIAAECAYLDRPGASGFERPYGWAWALALHGEAVRHGDRPWGAALAPLAAAFAARFRHFLPLHTYPIRTGTHFNTAFACLLAHEYAEAHDAPLAALIAARAHDWFAADRDAPAWEPGGDDFLSGTLAEAALMLRVLPDAGRRPWLDAFLPRLGSGEPATLFTPAAVSDRSDGKIAHLDGLNLSRAWLWRTLAPYLAAPVRDRVLAAAAAHEAVSLAHLDADYAGAHWLATYAALARLAA